ncbi:MAG: hypothetical protein ACFFD4_26305 [Candidatus Odinarchaeota archaeon]
MTVKLGIGSFFEYPRLNGKINEESAFFYLVNSTKDHVFLRDGRQAILAILLNIPSIAEKTCYLPAYACDSIIQPFKELDVELVFYSHVHPLKPVIDDKLEDCVLFIVDYFGVEHLATERINQFLEMNNTVIMDITHSLFSKNRLVIRHENYYLVSSLRKVFPIPDGGIVYHDNSGFVVKRSVPTGYEMMLEAMKMKALNRNKEHYLQLYRDYEWGKDKEKILLQDIPEISFHILKKLIIGDIIRKRTANMNYLYENLGTENFLFKRDDIKSPFFLPLLFEDGQQRNKAKDLLIENEIYPPVHWELSQQGFEYEVSISKRILSIPIDHRYDEKDMQRIVTVLEKAR